MINMAGVEETTDCSWDKALNFAILSLVRGTTPIMLYFAVHYVHYSSLVVAVKCGISVGFFLLSALFIMRKPDVRSLVYRNLNDKTTYFKLFVVGFFQSALPYMLIAYSVKYLPITLAGVFMVVTPWWVFLLERFPMIRRGDDKRFPTVLKIGMCIGIVGITVILIPVFVETAHCAAKQKAHSNTTTNISEAIYKTDILMGKTPDYCRSAKDVFNALIALAVVPIIWAAVAVFWKRHQGDIHYVVSSIGQNVFGGVVATITWLIYRAVAGGVTPVWDSKHWGYTFYLGAATGWLGTLLVRHLFSTIGSKTMNQVLTAIPLIVFIEDCVFIRDMITDHSYTLIAEMIGLILLTVGVFVSNIPSDETGIAYRRGEGNLTEPLITSDMPSEGLSAGLSQILQNQIHCYEDNSENADEPDSENEEIEAPMLPPLDTEINVDYPILSEVTDDVS